MILDFHAFNKPHLWQRNPAYLYRTLYFGSHRNPIANLFDWCNHVFTFRGLNRVWRYGTVDIKWTYQLNQVQICTQSFYSLSLYPEEFRKTQGKSHLTDNLAYFLGSGYIATDAVTKKVSIRVICPLHLMSDKMRHEGASKEKQQQKNTHIVTWGLIVENSMLVNIPSLSQSNLSQI